MAYLSILLADILLALDSVCSKKYQQWRGISSKAAYFFITITALLGGIIFFVINNFKLQITPFSLVICVIMNSLVIIYTLLGRFIIKYGTLAVYSLFLMTGGMVVPYIWGLLFLKENFSILKTIGLILIVLSVLFSNNMKQKSNFKFIILCFAVFFLNGFVSVTSKIHQIEKDYPTVSTTDFVIIGSVFKFLVMGILFLIQLKKNEPTFDNSKVHIGKVLLLLLISTILANASSYLLLQGAKEIPATVLYPLNTGGTIICTAISGVLIYKEKLTKNIIISIAICFIGTLMFL